MRYEGSIYRPPGEWRSYILQCTVGCSYNKCTFCEAYKQKKYHVKPLDYVLEDIEAAGLYYPGTDTVFLADGDAISLPVDYICTVAQRLKDTFPRLRRITVYAGPRSTAEKSDGELKTIVDAGVTRAYLGVESGDSEVLRHVKKGVTAEEMLEAGKRLRKAGFDLWVTVIAGLEGGGEAYKKNAVATARLLNEMAPQHISVMTLMCPRHTELYDEVASGRFVMQTPREALLETKLILKNLRLDGAHFTANHMSNYVPLKGTLGRDTEKFLSQLEIGLEHADEINQRIVYEHG